MTDLLLVTETQSEPINDLDLFWATMPQSKRLSQRELYISKQSPERIVKFIDKNNGKGIAAEKLARCRFTSLGERKKGKEQTGYDHIINVNSQIMYIEQKTSGHWSENDYRWQHVELGHKWDFLLLCGIDFHEVKFWGMTREMVKHLIAENKITNQGNKKKDSSEGVWFNYMDVRDYLVEITTNADMVQFASSSSATAISEAAVSAISV